jgi:hypothetical protein
MAAVHAHGLPSVWSTSQAIPADQRHSPEAISREEGFTVPAKNGTAGVKATTNPTTNHRRRVAHNSHRPAARNAEQAVADTSRIAYSVHGEDEMRLGHPTRR